MKPMRLVLPTVFLAVLPVLMAQPNRIARPVDPSRMVLLKGSTQMLLTEPHTEMGPADPQQRMAGITLMMKQTDAQHAALEQLLEEQRDPSSPNYHNWLTPEQFADRFGVSRDDMDKVVEWLESKGLNVDNIARGRNWLVVSGTVGQVQSAFRTEIHRFQVGNEMRVSNVLEPSVPADLENIILGIRGLDDFRPKPRAKIIPTPQPLDPHNTGSNGQHQLAPGDIGTIYNVNPLYGRGINGNGQKLVVVGQTDVNLADVRMFRSQFGLPASDPQMVLVTGSADPGTSQTDIGEANLDLDWSGAVAPNAQIIYVNSTNIYNSVQFAIDQNLAPVISMSYGYCEPKISSSPASSAQFFRGLAQQANASGITWLASSGDSGAADCDTGTTAKFGLAVDLPASVPEVTGVGGTEFNEGAGTFWNTTNTANGGSARSYIPEMVWNDSASRKSIIGGGGGSSMFFTKPSWQTGPGVPNDGARDVPDVSFAASPDHDGYFYVVGGKFGIVGGTSVATPVFAGMLALLNQSEVAGGAKAGLGNINPTLYSLAQTNPAIFHDVTVGSNSMPCTAGTPNCVNGTEGFNATAGYDRAAGLGSVDINALVSTWGARTSTAATTTTVSANPTSILSSASTVVTATVKGPGTATPTGTITFSRNNVTLGTGNLTGSGGAATASLTVNGTQLATGANTITASYPGSASFNASAGSTTVTVTVPTGGVSVVVASVSPDPVYQQADANGTPTWYFTVRLTETAGVASTLTAFTYNGVTEPLSLFGSTAIPAHGTLSASLSAINVTVPATVPLGFSGKDAGGHTWTQNISITFYGRQASAAMALTSTPNPVHQVTAGDPHCAPGYLFYHQLNLQEKNGYGVNLTRFWAGGFDLTSSIASYFGAARLAAQGTLHAGLCWPALTTPTNLSFEVDGTDVNGNKISATISVPFQGPVTNAGAFSVSKPSLVLGAAPEGTASANFSAQVPATEDWTVSIYPDNHTTGWLVMSPLGATGPTNVDVTASAAGLDPGVYTANLVFQSKNTNPQVVNVPVTLVVGGSSSVKINSVTNAASFDSTAAPGGYIAVSGTGLAPTTDVASVSPLPYSISGVSATVNGIPAPVQYISSTQLNIQVPYEVPAPVNADGTPDLTQPAVLGINNNGKVAAFTFQVMPSAPGIFLGNDGALVPQGTATRGGSLFFYITGEGDSSPPPTTGVPPAPDTPVDQFPKPLLPVSVTIGGVPAKVDFVGNLYVGVTQINVTVPQNAPAGKQQVVVTVGGALSKPGLVIVQ